MQVADEFISSAQPRKHSNSLMIVSYHVNGGNPLVEGLGNFVALMQSTGADIVKLTTDTVVITDVAQIFHLLSHSQV